MKTLEFGQDRPKSGNQYLRVKEKGDSVTFRIAQNPVYTGKHFQKTDAGWDVTSCPRVNDNDKCELCEKFFSIKADQKKAKEIADKVNEEMLGKEARKYAVSVIYYFPILNRLTGKFAILQVTEGVRNQIDAQSRAGVKVFQRDITLRNNGATDDNGNNRAPKDIYTIAVVDSADSTPLTDEETSEYKKAQEFDVSKINDRSNNTSEMSEVEVEEDNEQVREAKEIMNGPALTDEDMKKIDAK